MLITRFRPLSVPWPIRFFLPGELLWKGETGNRSVYLTFDDGPTPELTEKILEILAAQQARATFFCVGENVKKYPGLYRQIIEAGHAAGNHTQDHMIGSGTPTSDYLANIEEASGYISSSFFRPPHGRITREQARLAGKKYRIIMWTLLSWDHDPSADPEKMLKSLKRKTSPGSIVVFHDNMKARNNVLYMLPRYLEFLKNEGYSVDQQLKIKKSLVSKV